MTFPFPSILFRNYYAAAASFDGTNDYMTRGAGLTSAVDGKLLTLSFWLRKQGSDGVTERVVAGFGAVGASSANIFTRCAKQSTNAMALVGENAAGTVILNIASSANTFEVADGWVHFIASVDLTDTAKRHIYVDDVSDLVVTTYTNDTLDLTLADWAIGADADGGTKLTGDLAEVALWGAYIDLSVTANRRMFIDASGKPVNLAQAITTLGTPLIYQKGPAASFATNNGGGGNFTVTGALTDAATSPSD
jgi:hypothetical protein